MSAPLTDAQVVGVMFGPGAGSIAERFRSVPIEQAVLIAETVERLALAISGEDRPECVRYCVLALDHDEDCMTEQDIAEEQLRSRDYESWARL